MKVTNSKNICFYYYGKDHYLVNLYKYIRVNMENNIYTLMFVDEEVFNLLMDNFDLNEKGMIGYVPSDKMLTSKEFSNKERIKNYVDKIKEKFIKMGFTTIKFVLDSSKIIENTSSSIYTNFVEILSIICAENNIDILTCYDFEDYICRGKIINEEIIRTSYDIHEYRLFGNEILSVDNFKSGCI